MARSRSASPAGKDRKRDRSRSRERGDRDKDRDRERDAKRRRSASRDKLEDRKDDRRDEHRDRDDRKRPHDATAAAPAADDKDKERRDRPRDNKDKDSHNRDRKDEPKDKVDRDKDKSDRDKHREHDKDRKRDGPRDEKDERAKDRDKDSQRVKDRDKERERDRRDRKRSQSRSPSRRGRSHDDRPAAAAPDRRIKTEDAEEGEAPANLPLPPPLPPSLQPVIKKEEVGVKPEADQRSLSAPSTSEPVRRAQPLSLEELLKKKKQQQEAEAKPKFLTKAEREALALAKLAAQRDAQMSTSSAQLGALRVASAAAAATGGGHGGLPPPPALPDRDRDRRDRDRGYDRGDRDRDLNDRDRNDRDRGRDGDRERAGGRERDRGDGDRRGDDRRGDDRRGREREGDRDKEAADRKRPGEEREREKELQMIKQQYLGQEKAKKRIMKPSDKFKFNFDWDAQDDTSRDLNPLYNNLHEAALLFGRGMRAGIDRREQKKQAATMESENMRRARAAAGLGETHESRQAERAREKLADQYDGFDMRIEKHWTEKALSDMTERDWRIFREDFNIGYRGVNTVLPIRKWDEANLPEALRQAVEKVGYKKPSPIQMAAIPLGMQQRDVIGVAETGSGKTAAFVLPMLAYIMKQPAMNEENEADGPYAVVLAPTRELAQQIEEETIKLAHFTPYRVTSVVGGQSIEEQGNKLRKGCEIVIATPGRLLDCIDRHYAVLNQCNYVVLDEADRMIDLGFEPQVIGVLDAMPSSNLKPENEDATLEEGKVYRTTYMFSATMPMAVERLARKYLRRPVVVTIGSAGRVTDNVTQRVVITKENEKSRCLDQELEAVKDDAKVIVFVNTQRQCDYVHRHLEEMGHRCTILHGGKSQDAREAGIKGFREGTYNVLIATDVAGRGIDVPDVALVINYDMPAGIEAYTHRIGRTGRAGKKGTAVTFLTMGDTGVFYDLKKLLEDSKASVPAELARHEAAKVKPGAIDAKPKRDATVFAKK